MPPKNKYTREEIVSAALSIAKEKGIDAVTARDVGAKLGTSSKPVYTAFDSMEELKRAVLEAANAVFEAYQEKESQNPDYPPYKALGMAYIRFAKEEKELFKLLYMRDRRGETEKAENAPSYGTGVQMVETQTGLRTENANLFHAEMWMYVHGIAVMLATSYLEWDFDRISRMVTDVYEGLKWRYAEKKGQNDEKYH